MIKLFVTNKREMAAAKRASIDYCLRVNLPEGETDITTSRTYNVHAPYAVVAGILPCVYDGSSHPDCPCPCGHTMKTKRSALRDSTQMQWRCSCWRYFSHVGFDAFIEDGA